MGVAVSLHDPRAHLAARSYSQQGEDLIVESICKFLGIGSPTYLDVGAAHPIQGSNTYLFYLKGCRGVLVEPNPDLCRGLRATRPGDVVLNAGIGFDGRAEADYYMLSGYAQNTFSERQVAALAVKVGNRSFIKRVVRMPLLDINRVIADHFGGRAPDFLSIDCEGVDFDILGTLNFDRFRPKILCVETLIIETTKEDSRILELMQSKGYTVRGSTFVNRIFVDNRLL
jgi:FkbM family methyltransferase